MTWQRRSKRSGGGIRSMTARLVLSTILVLSLVLVMTAAASAANSWTSTGGPPTSGNPATCLALDQTHNILYAGADTGEVYRYQNGVWSSTGGPSAQVRINDIVYDPVSNTVVAALYIDSSFQVWTYQEGGSWTLTSGGPGNTNPSSVASDGAQKKLYAGVYGGGVYAYDYQSGPGPWVGTGSPLNSIRCMQMDTTRHVLYAGGSNGTVWPPNAAVARYDGANWTPFGEMSMVQVSSLALDSSRNILYAGLWTNVTGLVNVYRKNIAAGGDWVGIGTLCGGPEIFSLAVDEVNNTLYALAYDGHVYKNCDASVGSTWLDLGVVSVNTNFNFSLQYDPANATLFCGTGNPDGQVYSQGISALTAIDPASGAQWQTLDVDLTASNSSFTDSSQVVFSGDGVNVNSTTLIGLNKLRANITIKPGTYLGPRNVLVKTGGDKTNKLVDGFTVTDGTPVISSISPSSGTAGTDVTIKGTYFGAPGGTSRVNFGTVEAESCSSWSDTEIVAKVPRGLSGDVDVTVTTAVGTSNAKTFTSALTAWYLAEGSTAWGFNTYITIQNPNTDAVTAKITYMDPNAPASGKGIVATRTVNLPTQSQTTVDPRWDLGNTDFSTKVECLQGKNIAVDRTMFWTGPGAPSPEGHSSVGTTSPSTNWDLPEGSSAWGFETWTLVENPNPTAAQVTLTYMIEGQAPKAFAKTIPAYSRATYSMASDLGQQADASIQVSSNTPVIAEESMYRNNRREGSCSIGATAPSTNFYLSEGTTAWGFTTYVLVQNPNDTPTDVTLTYMTPGGPRTQPAFTMQPNSRKTVRVNDIKPSNGYPIDVSNTDLSIQVAGTKPIIAERSMYWGADTPLGEACHASIGLSQPHMTFYLPDGQTSNGYQTWTLVANPNPGAVTVRITYMTPTGTGNVTFTDEIPAGSRKTYNMADKLPAGRASVMVQSLDGARPVMVERSMYWNNRGAGSNTIGGFSD